MKWIIPILLSFLAVTSSGAASFDCAKAGTKVEKMICGDAEISKLDDKLAQNYKAALLDKSKAEAIEQAQRQWVKDRNGCSDTVCVKQAYEKRIDALSFPLQQSNTKNRSKQRFTVSQGKGWTVCESYARYLNSLPDSTPLPLCHIPRYPDFPDLKEPDWEVMDIQSNLELVYKLEKLTSPSYHDRPVDTFDHWKTVFDQQIKEGVASPRLRSTHLALLDKGPVETIMAYEPDQEKCDREMTKNGFAYNGALTNLYLWNEQEQRIDNDKNYIGRIPFDLLLFQGKPLLFLSAWGFGTNPRLTGGIAVYHFVSAGIGNQYGRVPRCAISFDLPSTLIERMTK